MNNLWISPKLFWINSALLLVLNAVSAYLENYYIVLFTFLMPLVYYSIFDFKKLYFFTVFITPFSLAFEELIPGIGFNFSLPAEIILSILLLITLLKFFEGNFFKTRIFMHPISLAVLFYLFWMFMTCISSSMPMVSFKHFLAQCWFVFPLFYLPIVLFKRHKYILLFIGLYAISLAIVVLYTINNHLAFGLNSKDASNIVMKPFYSDHTSYGAVLAMFVTFFATTLFSKRLGTLYKFMTGVLLLLFTIALVLSYTRAAWISVAMAGFLAFILILKIKVRYLALLGMIGALFLFVYRIEIIDKLNKNKQDASANISDHIKSISNIATDASNLERINRWNSAMAMFKERPILGWGPGTYMFQYAPFQKARDKTIISTNFAEGGNAHSEYIGPLAEQGILGMLAFLAIIATFLFTALKLYFKQTDKEFRLLVLACLLSVTTYFIHGMLNNFLDTDKLAVPFWGMLAIICSLDLYATKNKNPQLGAAEER